MNSSLKQIGMAIDRNKDLMITSLQFKDLDFLKEMFYTSLFVAKGEEPFPTTIIEKPGLARYYREWGRKSDLGFLAILDGEAVGAVWSRFFTNEDPGYGFVEEQAPEIGIALREGVRGQGIGTQLLRHLLDALSKAGVPAVSLSADSRNRALGLYRKFGFQIVKKKGYALVMYRSLEWVTQEHT